MNGFSRTMVVVCALAAAGCASRMPTPGDPRFAPVYPVTPRQDVVMNNGSIYANSMGVGLYEDQRARRVGDILTVLLEERTSSSKTSGTDLNKADENQMGVSSLFGLLPNTKVPGGGDSSFTLNSSTKNDRKFAGEASANQGNQLQGFITVTVADVLANGVLLVRGEKWLTLTQGDEYIRIEGLVRTSDISPDNTVMSNKLADARIAYGATGDFADVNSKGWLSRFFSSEMWPF
jgi:flagellar L-ring protein precursor FlgH